MMDAIMDITEIILALEGVVPILQPVPKVVAMLIMVIPMPIALAGFVILPLLVQTNALPQVPPNTNALVTQFKREPVETMMQILV
jgi:hypothetical protein